ncbi:hypothetical protein FB45DRAFT_887431, partial [Roridomyces roridus]
MHHTAIDDVTAAIMYPRRRPHVDIPPLPPGARVPEPPSPSYSIQVTPPPYDYDPESPSSGTPRPRVHSLYQTPPNLPPSRSVSVAESGFMPFPEPQIYRSASASASMQSIGHRYSKSDLGPTGNLRLQRDPSTTSLLTDAYYTNGDDSDFYASGSADSHGDPTESREDPSHEPSQASLESAEGIHLFQTGRLPDAEWYKLVSTEARDALGKREVQRQSVIFEVFKAEREYVADLDAVRDVFIDGLRSASPPVIPESILNKFIKEVFGNIDEVVAQHHAMLGALFARQREQHPLVQSVSDIVLDMALNEQFLTSYDVYIKNYPLAESRHRKEFMQNKAYQTLIQSVSSDPRIRKREMTTFLSRPVTRLPRLNLLLEQILKLTDDAHPDKETLPVIIDILTACVKSTQPGIEAAENKVKFWELCQSLVFQRGEIIDMDLYVDTRNLVRLAPVARWNSEGGLSSWVDLTAALLDNYLLLTREEIRANGVKKRYLVSRPIPLSYLRLGAFNLPPDNRRDGLKFHSVHPFVICHASGKSRKYTLYVSTEAERKRWYTVLQEAIGLHRIRQEANMYFEPHTLTDRFFRVPTVRTKGAKPTGRITTAAPFVSDGRKFLAVGCFSGVYAGHWEDENFSKALTASSPASLFAVETLANKPFGRFVVHHDSSLLSYSLDVLGRLALGQADPKTLVGTMEKHDNSNNVLIARIIQMEHRLLILYTSKRVFQSTLDLHVLEAVREHHAPPATPTRRTSPRYFRPFGDPGYVPKDAHEITGLRKTVAVSTQDRIFILDPLDITKSILFVPDFTADTQSKANATDMAALKKRLEGCKPLGLVRRTDNELLAVYDSMGCYVSRRGVPLRSSGYIRWESKAVAYATRGQHLLLFSPNFVEIRSVLTGLLVQVIEGYDIRLLHSSEAHILVAMRGGRDDEAGTSERIVDLQETAEIAGPPTAAPVEHHQSFNRWDEWDM